MHHTMKVRVELHEVSDDSILLRQDQKLKDYKDMADMKETHTSFAAGGWGHPEVQHFCYILACSSQTHQWPPERSVH